MWGLVRRSFGLHTRFVTVPLPATQGSFGRGIGTASPAFPTPPAMGPFLRSFASWDIDACRFATDTDIGLPVMVSSHERSGTHFLINTLAKNSAYRNNPYLDYDSEPLGSFHNFHESGDVVRFFQKLDERKCASVIKSHFAAPFFRGADRTLLTAGLCKILYIARTPFEVLLSYHRFVLHFPWYEGPKPKRVLDFVTAAPEGRMLRYQWQQFATIIERWKMHVTRWHELAAEYPDDILFMRYGDLDQAHAAETKRALAFIGCEPPDEIARPDRFVRTVQVPPAPRPPLDECELILRAIAETIGNDATIRHIFPELFGGASQAVAG